jgi:nucleoside-diphosphate-sugar epimerase
MEGVTTVIHCVGLIHPKRVRDLFTVNVEGTRNVLEAASNAGVRRFVYISSNSPAGLNRRRNHLLSESDPARPYMAYGRSKDLAEKLVRSFHRPGVFETVILRPCWFYGPGMGQPERQLRFFRMIQKGNPILFGNGKNLRSMSYLDNTIQAILLAEKTPQAAGQIYWIADTRPYTTLEVYETIARLFNTALTPRRIPGLASAICRVVDRVLQAMGLYITEFHVAGEMDRDIACDISKARRELGYEPQVSLEEGMRRSLEWARLHQGFDL